MIPILYDKLFQNKIGELSEAISVEVLEERNGEFELSLVYPANGALLHSLENEMIIVAKANDELEEQKFRIYMSRKLMANRVNIYARHISFDAAYDIIPDISIENQSCEYALNTIFRSSQFSQHFRGYSDIVMSANYNIESTNVIKAIAGQRGSIIDTYGNGADILRDNESIHVLKSRGRQNGVSVEYRKNLTGLTVDEDMSELVTRIKPYAIYTNENNEQITVEADFVDSPYINDYAHPYISRIDYSDKFEQDELPTATKLKALAQNDFTNNKVDIPKTNYKIEFIPLSKCAGYEGLEDKIVLCDTVIIKDTRYNIDTLAKVIKVTYDVLRERYVKMELGEPRTRLGDIITNEDPTQGPAGPAGPQGPSGNDGSDGLDAKVVKLRGTQIFKYPNGYNGAPEPSSITLTLDEYNLDPSPSRKWYYKIGDGAYTLISSANNKTSYTIMPTDSTLWSTNYAVTIKVESDGVADELTIIKVADGADGTPGADGNDGAPGTPGADGEDGADAYTVVLTNEAFVFPALNDGTIESAITTSTSVMAFKGNFTVTPTYGTIANPSGMTITRNSNQFTITALKGTSLADTGSFTIPVIIEGITFNKVFSWSKAKKGEAGPQGPAGDDAAFPDTTPTKPVTTTRVFGFGSVDISWTFENTIYYSYEVYASKTKGFTPNTFDLIYAGKASSFLHDIKAGETWYYRVCGINSYGRRGSFSDEVSATGKKVSDASTYFESASIKEALIGTLSLDRGWVGTLTGNYMDMRHVVVTNGNGVRTFEVDAAGAVRINATEVNILAGGTGNIATKEELDTVKNTIDDQIEDVIVANQLTLDHINTLTGDDYVTEAERADVKSLMEQIEAQYGTLKSTVSKFGNSYLDSLMAQVTSAYDSLIPLLQVIVDGATTGMMSMRVALTTYYNKYHDILYAISSVTKESIDYMSSEIQLQAGRIDMAVSQSGSAYNSYLEISKHMTFTLDGWLEIYGSINGQPSPFKMQLSDTRLSFFDNGSEVAYVSNDKLNIETAEIKREMKIGNYIMSKSAKGGIVFRKGV